MCVKAQKLHIGGAVGLAHEGSGYRVHQRGIGGGVSVVLQFSIRGVMHFVQSLVGQCVVDVKADATEQLYRTKKADMHI